MALDGTRPGQEWAAQSTYGMGEERPPSDHLDVVWILKHDLPKEWSDAELKFWLACAKRDLRKVAYALRGSDRQIPINFREPICADLEREITKPTVEEDGTQPAYDLFATVDVLNSWGYPDDTPLLRKYLKHPLHETSSRFRSNLQYMLKKRGVRAPYLQEETSPFPNNQSESNSS